MPPILYPGLNENCSIYSNIEITSGVIVIVLNWLNLQQYIEDGKLRELILMGGLAVASGITCMQCLSNFDIDGWILALKNIKPGTLPIKTTFCWFLKVQKRGCYVKVVKQWTKTLEFPNQYLLLNNIISELSQPNSAQVRVKDNVIGLWPTPPTTNV